MGWEPQVELEATPNVASLQMKEEGTGSRLIENKGSDHELIARSSERNEGRRTMCPTGLLTQYVDHIQKDAPSSFLSSKVHSFVTRNLPFSNRTKFQILPPFSYIFD